MKIINYNPKAIENEIQSVRKSISAKLKKRSSRLAEIFIGIAVLLGLLYCAMSLNNIDKVLVIITRLLGIVFLVVGVTFLVYTFRGERKLNPTELRIWFHRNASRYTIVDVRRVACYNGTFLEISVEGADGTVMDFASPPVQVVEASDLDETTLDLATGQLLIRSEDLDVEDFGVPVCEGDML